MSLSTESRTGRAVAVLAFAFLLLLVVAVTILVRRSIDHQESQATRARTEDAVVAIEARMIAYTEVLYGVRSALSRGGQLSHTEYHELIEELDVDGRYPGVQMIGTARLVDRDVLPAWEETVNRAASASGLDYPPFEVHPATANGLVLAIDHIEPQVGNAPAFGFDVMSESSRREAAVRAQDSGLPAATGPIRLAQESETQLAVAVMMPIYRPGLPLDTDEERRDAFVGVVSAAFRMGDLLAAVFSDDVVGDIEVIDRYSGRLLFDGDPTSDPDLSATPDDRSGELMVGGRQWVVRIHGGEPLLSTMERAAPLAVLLSGLGVAALLATLIGSLITGRARSASLAMEMTAELEAITESTSEAIISVDETGTIVAWNRGATEIFGWDANERMGKSIVDLVPDAYRGRFRAGMAEAFSDADDSVIVEQRELLARHTDDHEFPIELSVSRWTARGRTFLTGFMRDVTERVEARRQIRETSDLLAAVLDAATELAIIGYHPSGKIALVNAGAERMLGWTADELIGQEGPMVFHDPAEVRARAEELGMEPGFEVFVQAARMGMPETRTWTHVRKNGTSFPAELTISPMHGRDGEPNGFIGISWDVTDRMAAEQAGRDAMERQRQMVAKLTDLDRAKSDFISTTSHELRTPLTSIIGYSELLADEFGSAGAGRSGEIVEMIERNAGRLLLLVEDLLSLSRIESGSFHLNRKPASCARILDAACDAVAPLADARSVAVHRAMGDLPMMSADEPQLERVFLNLLSNAVKFSHEGGRVEVTAIADDDGIIVAIQDHGIGIPADEQDQLFTRFFRSRSAEDQAIDGTGLGLSIVARIVERHGGTIEVTSSEGIGTTVTVRLPADSIPHRTSNPREVPA